MQYAHARICVAAAQRAPSSASTLGELRPRAARPRARGRPAAARSASSRGSSPAPPSCASRTGSRATSRTLAGTYHRFYDACRVLPQGDEEPTDADPRPAVAVRGHPRRAGERPRPARRLRAGADVSGARTGRAAARRRHCPSRCRARAAGRPERARPAGLAAGVERGADGVLTVGGVDVRELAARVRHPGVRARRGRLPRRGPRAWRDAFAGGDVYYAGKAFLCTAVARWVAEEGLGLDVCTGGELAVALRGRASRPSGSPCTATTSRSPSCAAAVDAGVGRVVVDSFDEIDRLAALAAERGRARSGCWSGSPSASRRTPTSSSPPRTRTRSSASRCATATRPRPSRAVLGQPTLRAGRAALAHRLADLRHRRLRGRRAPRRRPARARSATTHGVELPELDLGGGLGIAYAAGDDPSRRSRRRSAAARDRRARVRRGRARRAAAGGRAGPGDRRAERRSRSTRSARSSRSTSARGAVRTYVSVDGGMSDNIRTALYDADYTCVLASRASRRAADAVPGWSASTARAATSSCATRGCRPTSRRVTCSPSPATGAYCRSMASNYNHVPRPPVVAVRDGAARRSIVRRETDGRPAARWTLGE